MPPGLHIASCGGLDLVASNGGAIREALVGHRVGFALFERPEYPPLVASLEAGDTSEWSSAQP